MKTAKEAKWLGSLPATLAIKSCDIGEATLVDGTTVVITWGRNLELEGKDCRWYAEKTVFEPILMPNSKFAELIIPKKEAAQLRTILVLQ